MAVQSFRIIREKIDALVKTGKVAIKDKKGKPLKKFAPHRMANELGLAQTQLKTLENESKSTQTHVLIKLSGLAQEYLGWTDGEFWKFFKEAEREEAQQTKRKKK